MARSTTSSDQPDQPPFEELLRRIEEITSQLEGGKLSLNDSLASYEEAIRHLRTCFGILERAEQRVALVTGVAADGSPVCQRFDEVLFTLEEKTEQRSSRRSARSESSPGQKSLLNDD
jgi:exodeoxyribonuclease VII small subunit